MYLYLYLYLYLFFEMRRCGAVSRCATELEIDAARAGVCTAQKAVSRIFATLMLLARRRFTPFASRTMFTSQSWSLLGAERLITCLLRGAGLRLLSLHRSPLRLVLAGRLRSSSAPFLDPTASNSLIVKKPRTRKFKVCMLST